MEEFCCPDIYVGDRNRDGHLDPSEFPTSKKPMPHWQTADFGYFDENQDGKITRKEFVEKPERVILRFDRTATAASLRMKSERGHPEGSAGPT